MEFNPDSSPTGPNPAVNGAAPSLDQRARGQRLRTIVIDNIVVFVLAWRGHFLLRRIDSDYVDLTTLCSARRRPDIHEQFRTLPGVVVVEGNRKEMVDGIWVHLSLVTERKNVTGMREDLVSELLDVNAVKSFPSLADTLSTFRATQHDRHRFDLPFGYKTMYHPLERIPTGTSAAEIESRLQTFHLESNPRPGKASMHQRRTLGLHRPRIIPFKSL
ncbi:hypothetical protein QFC20_002612 [Naganishia adeliensis]|uniref:Uncharacterized protein n=1 Tax=Naganishia adeliensis TaxID=92952 RepID=A0ACC2WIR6_9TREE|nr:hypothetical protein QFC20_002612 [Naganishia adeliensis]